MCICISFSPHWTNLITATYKLLCEPHIHALCSCNWDVLFTIYTLNFIVRYLQLVCVQSWETVDSMHKASCLKAKNHWKQVSLAYVSTFSNKYNEVVLYYYCIICCIIFSKFLMQIYYFKASSDIDLCLVISEEDKRKCTISFLITTHFDKVNSRTNSMSIWWQDNIILYIRTFLFIYFTLTTTLFKLSIILMKSGNP